MTVTYGTRDIDVTAVDLNATTSIAGGPLHVVHGTTGGRRVHFYASDSLLADLNLNHLQSTEEIGASR